MSKVTILAAGTTIAALILSPTGPDWYTVSVLLAGIGNYFCEPWVMSNKVGSAQTLSTAVKSMCSLITLYAMVGILVNIYHIIMWL